MIILVNGSIDFMNGVSYEIKKIFFGDTIISHISHTDRLSTDRNKP